MCKCTYSAEPLSVFGIIGNDCLMASEHDLVDPLVMVGNVCCDSINVYICLLKSHHESRKIL